MKVRIKKLVENAVIPQYAHATGDAGLDLVATSCTTDENQCFVYGTGLAFEIPEGYVGLLFPRSSNSKKELILTNCVGVLDSSYRGEVMFKFRQLSHHIGAIEHPVTGQVNVFQKLPGRNKVYQVGDRIGQLIIMPYPKIEFEEADELSSTERGEGGYGSTGK